MSSKQHITAFIEANKDIFTQLNDAVWESPELGFLEYRSSQTLINALAELGFDIETNLAGIPTAFRGSWGSGKPVIAFLGEFDALPNLSQKAACAEKIPTENSTDGHGCGHCSLGAGSVAAAAALKDYMQHNNISGTIVYFGCPAEESGCGKTFMAREGVFDNTDIAITWHPDTTNHVFNISTLANLIVEFSFKGTTSHAAASPHLGRSALDAAELMNVGVNYLREHIIPEARVHYAYRDCGGGAPNVVQDSATLLYYIRAPKTEQVLEIFPRVVCCAEGAAHMTGTSVKVNIKTALSDFIPNKVVSTVMSEAMEETGCPEFSQQAYLLAEKMQKTLTETEFKAGVSVLAEFMSYDKAAKRMEDRLIPDVFPYIPKADCMPGSTDVGDVSYIVPTAQLQAVTAAIGTPFHSWQFTAQAKSVIAHEGLIYAAKVMSLTGAKLLENPKLITDARAELLSATGGVYHCPIPKDVKPTP